MFPIFSNQRIRFLIYTTENVTLTVRGQVRVNAGQANESISIINDEYIISNVTSGVFSSNSKFKNLPAGELISLLVSCSTSSIQRGQCFIRADVVDTDSNPAAALFSDYVTSKNAVGFPFTGLQSSLSGRGHIFRKLNGQPPAGAAFTYSVDSTNLLLKLIRVHIQLTTGAAAANRRVRVIHNSAFKFLSNITQVASETRDYDWGHSMLSQDFNSSGAIFYDDASLPGECFILDSLSIGVLNIQAADQISNIYLAFEQWIKA